MYRYVCLGIMSLCVIVFTRAQEPAHIFHETKNHLVIQGLSNKKLIKSLRKSLGPITNLDTIIKHVNPWYEDIHHEGWIETSLEGYEQTGDTIMLNFHQGKRYFLESLQIKNLPELIFQRSGLTSLSEKRRPYDQQRLINKLYECISLFQDQGYPFATFSQETIQYDQWGKDSVLCHLFFSFAKGEQFRIDSLVFRGNIREPQRFLHGLVRLQPGAIYQKSFVDNIPAILENTIYYQTVDTPLVRYTNSNQAHIQVDLESAKPGKLDLLLGLLPGTGRDGKLQFVGSADIKLVSSFRQGEIIAFSYDKLTSTSQQLHASISVPYLLGSPFQFEGSFDIFNLEEDYLVRAFTGGGAYAISPHLFAKLSIKNRASRLLDSLKNVPSGLPQQLDGEHSLIIGGLSYEKVDYLPNPGKGLTWDLTIGVGNRKLRRNSLVAEEIYQDLPESQAVLEVDLGIKWYQTLSRRGVIYLANHTYWLQQDQFFQNDQLQVGGAKSIRGFNENELFTDLYSFFTFEYRLRLERDSYIFALADYAWLRDRVRQNNFHPTGLGIGMNYGTKAGVIRISYAVGRIEGSPFQPSRGKIHIGFVNEF